VIATAVPTPAFDASLTVPVAHCPPTMMLGLTEILLRVAFFRTVKATPLLATPLTVTTTSPLVAPVGTGTTMLVALQLVGVAAVPWKVMLLEP
jgi:hypothetical protein